MRNLCQELDFVGEIKKIEWFNRDLVQDSWFMGLVERVVEHRSDTTLRNIFYSFFPITEYINHEHRVEDEEFASFEGWRNIVSQNETQFLQLVCQHGTQGNIPQRAAMVLDFLSEADILDSQNILLEIGCSAGLMGNVFENYSSLFSGESLDRYFWLKRIPRTPAGVEFLYIGYDLMPPPRELVPFFVWDKEKRSKVSSFLRDHPVEARVIKKSAWDFFTEESSYVSRIRDRNIIILTSFVLYQFDDAGCVQDKIMQLVGDKIHWVDLSRNNNLPSLFADQSQLRPNWIYLSHNGRQIAEVVDGSDDCPNWRYL